MIVNVSLKIPLHLGVSSRCRGISLLYEIDLLQNRYRQSLQRLLHVQIRLDLGEVESDADGCLSQFGADAGEDDVDADEAQDVVDLEQVVGDVGVDHLDARQIDDQGIQMQLRDAGDHVFVDVSRPVGVDGADQGQDRDAFVDRDDGRG